MKITEKILISFIISLLLFFILSLLKFNRVMSFILSEVVFFFIIFVLSTKKESYKPMTYRDFVVCICIKKDNYLNEKLLSKIYPNVERIKNLNLYKIEDKFIYFHMAFSKISPDYLITIYNSIKDIKIPEINIISIDKDNKAIYLNKYLKTKFYITTYRLLYKKLKARKFLPSIKSKYHVDTNFQRIITNMFSRRNIKLYLLCSISLFLFSLITPLKTYYITFGFITLALSFLGIVYQRHNKHIL